MTLEEQIEQVRMENKRLRQEKEALKKALAEAKMKATFAEAENQSLFHQIMQQSSYIRELERVL